MHKSSETVPTPFDDADLFDLLYDTLDYGLDFYLRLAREAGGPILDLTCGTGRVLLPWLAEGLDADGVDLSPALLARLREKAKARGLAVRAYEADMRTFQLDRRYALIAIPCNSFAHNLTTDDQVATLTRCREHLLPGGQLAFDGFFPSPALVMAPDNTRVLEGETKHPRTGLPVRHYDTRSFDRVEQIQHSYNETELLDAAGNVTAVYPTRTSARWVYKHEMALLLRIAGFGRWTISGDFDGRPLVKETDGMVVQAWND